MEPNKGIQGGISQFFSYPDANWTELKIAAARLIQSTYDQACDHPDGQAHIQKAVSRVSWIIPIQQFFRE